MPELDPKTPKPPEVLAYGTDASAHSLEKTLLLVGAGCLILSILAAAFALSGWMNKVPKPFLALWITWPPAALGVIASQVYLKLASGPRRHPRYTNCLLILATAWLAALPQMLPRLAHPIGPKLTIACASRLRTIGNALRLYADEYRGAYPPTLAPLLAGEYINSSELNCPLFDSANPPPPTSYIYYPPTGTPPPDWVLMIEKPGNHKAETNVLFFDGHTETISSAQAQKVIAAGGGPLPP